ncbi:MAG TPA: IS66 family transposase, partial [Chloroflexota bacterium]|nr:IS66 family transposase [Chloroflexota bacterium]
QLRLREQQLFGRKTEATAATAPHLPPGRPDAPPPRPRGQQPGRPGPRRRDYAHLPAVVEDREIPGDRCCCRRCGRPFAPVSGTEDSTILEVEVKAHRRLIRRHRYRPTCACGAHPGLVTAPPAPRVIPKSILGVSVWVAVLLDKYLSYRPTYRLLAELRTHGLDLSLGTVTDGLRRLVPLFEPVYAALAAHSRRQPLWHADETRWQVFATVEGKVGYRWYLWAFHAAEVVVFVLAQGRSHDVPEQYLGPDAQGIMVVDRYKAYQAIDQVKRGLIVLAFCWAHVRRDFVTVARTWPDQEGWALGWVGRIGAIYRLNDERRAVLKDPAAFAPADARLRAAVTALGAQGEAELAEASLHPARRKVLESLGEHWTGLTVFVEHPEVPMDNNTAERAERGPVVGRKNYYGSGAVWAGRLAAMLFSLLQTLCLWRLNPRSWLTAYLTACAACGGEAPADVERFLPWNLSDEQRQGWSMAGEEAGEDTS